MKQQRAQQIDIDNFTLDPNFTANFPDPNFRWDELAFRAVKETLERYFSDRRTGIFTVHTVDIA